MTDTADTPSIENPSSAELAAIGSSVGPLSRLTPAGQDRVLNYLTSLFEANVFAPMGPLPDEDLYADACRWACAVLDMLDAREIEQSCLDALGMGEGPSMAEAQLREIKRRFAMVAGSPEGVGAWQST